MRNAEAAEAVVIAAGEEDEEPIATFEMSPRTISHTGGVDSVSPDGGSRARL